MTDTGPFLDAPSPWHCKGECFWFNTYLSPPRGGYPSSAHFNQVERDTSFSDPTVSGDWKGGLASVMVIRYTETPVGPYDELIWSPGKFTVPAGGPKTAMRITRIYVSTKASVYNGRKNWNICKQQAQFEFTPHPDAGSTSLPYSKITIANPEDPEHPFFVAEISPSLLSSASIPFSTSYIPMSMYMAHPPLPQSPNWKETGQIGTDRWWALTPKMQGKAGLFWGKGGLPDGKFGDNVGFPDVSLWSMGMWLRNFELEFGSGEQIGESIPEAPEAAVSSEQPQE